MKEALTYSASYPEKHRWVCRGHGLKRVWAICTEAKCNEALSGTKGAGYRGCQTRTRSGKTCQPWSSQSPHKHTSNKSRPSTNPSAGLDSNYCRNPDGEPSIWCFTTDPKTRWELCNPGNVLLQCFGWWLEALKPYTTMCWQPSARVSVHIYAYAHISPHVCA